MKEIIHLADLHIRCGLSDKSRYLEYHNVFTNIVNDLATYPAVVAKNAVIVIAGDIFHHKLTIHSPGIKLFLEFASRLASLAHVYVIRGNHDYRQDIPDEPALISALLGIGIPGVSYIDNTCTVLVDDDIGFGICAIQNTLHRGNTSGICSELPPFPDPSEFPANIKKKIAIFHGSVASSNEHTQSTYPISWFNGYDAVILGDIHVQQVHNGFEIRGKEEESTFENSVLVKKYKCDSGAMPWAYSGSVLQQNFGEHLMGHGFIIWDLDNEIIKCYHCVNKYGFVTVKYTDECSQWMVSGSSWTILDDVIDKPWFPTNIMLRIVENDNQAYFKLAAIVSKIFAAHHKIVVDIKHHCGKDNDINLDVVDVTVADTVDITSFNNPTTWIEFLTKCGVPGRDEWRCWMTDPDDLYMLEPEDDLDLGPVIEKNIKDRDEKFSKEIWAYISRYDLLHNVVQAKHCFTINNLKWNWILCYKDNCFFDFDSMTKSIYAIVARNGNGKTSFLETICIALFGEGFPSRTTKNSDTSIICAEKPMSSKANTSITVTVNNKTFCINREFKQKDGKLVPQTRTTNISEGISEIHSGKTAVGDWVKQNIGDINAFLLSCMVSQNNDMDFFSLKSVDQQSLLDTALCINSATEFKSLLDSAHLNHKKILADLNAKCATLSRVLVTPDFDQDYIVSVKKDILRYTSENQLFMSAHNVLLKKVGNNDGILDSCSKELIGEYIKRFSRVVNTTFLDDSDLGKLTGMYEYALCNYASCQQFSGKGSGMSLDDLIDKRNALVQPGKTFEFIKKRLAELKWHYGDIDNSIDGIDLDVKKDMLTALLKNKPRLPRFSTKEHISWNKKMSVILHKYKSVDEVVGQLNKITIIDPPDVSHQVAKYQLSSLGTHEGTGQSEEELLLMSKQHNESKQNVTISDISKKEYNSFKNEINELIAKYGHDFGNCIKVERPTVHHAIVLDALDELAKLDKMSVAGDDGDSDAFGDFSTVNNLVSATKRDIDLAKQNLLALSIAKPELGKYKTLETFNIDNHIYLSTMNDLAKTVGRSIAKAKKALASTLDLQTQWNENESVMTRSSEYIESVNMCDDFNKDCWACCNRVGFKKHEDIISKCTDLRASLSSQITEATGSVCGLDTFIQQNRLFIELSKTNGSWKLEQDMLSAFNVWKEECAKAEVVVSDKMEEYNTLLVKKARILHRLNQQWNNYNKFIDITRYKECVHAVNSYETWTNWNETNDEISSNYNVVRYTNILTKWKVYDDAVSRVAELQGVVADFEKNKEFVADASLLVDNDNWKVRVATLEKELVDMEIGSLVKDLDTYNLIANIEGEIAELINAKKRQEFKSQVDSLAEHIRKIKELDSAQKQLTLYTQCYALWDEWHCNYQKQIADNNELINKARIQVASCEKWMADYIASLKVIQDHERFAQRISDRVKLLEPLTEAFGGFKTWIYNSKVFPVITHRANEIINIMCGESRPLHIVAEATDAMFYWSLRDGVSCPPIVKASGFQRFIAGLAIRLALGHVGATSIKPSQLFLDEGFVACDADNIEKVHDFLDNLRHMYKHIVIVTHLEQVKTCAEHEIHIVRKPCETLSCLQFTE